MCKEVAVVLIGTLIAELLGRRVVGKLLDSKLNFKDVFFPSSIVSDKEDLESVKKKWKAALSSDVSRKGGILLAMFERFAFVSAFGFFKEESSYLLIGGWLAFKIAAKWDAWEHIHKFPEKLKEREQDILEELRARNEIGSITLSRFLIGTLGNILAGYLGFYLASKLFIPLFKAIVPTAIKNFLCIL